MQEVMSLSLGDATQSVSLELVGDWGKVYQPSGIGRKFTEILLRSRLQGQNVLDVGCGSGVISIAAALCNANVTAVDVNEVAVETTIRNAKHNDVDVDVIVSDGLNSVSKTDYDIIVANCPIVPAELSTEQNTPVDNGPEGFRLWNHVVAEAGKHLAPHGSLIVSLPEWSQHYVDSQSHMRTHWRYREVVATVDHSLTKIGAFGGLYNSENSANNSSLTDHLDLVGEEYWSSTSFIRLCDPIGNR